MITGIRNCTLLAATIGLLASCNSLKKKQDKSSVTGWAYNDKKTGGFTVAKPKDIKTGPGLVFVQGGTFTMGASQEDVMGDWNNIPKRVTVNSFFIDKTEVANVHYREYIYWVESTFGDDEKYKQAIEDVKPDTLVWRSELSYNEPYVEYYFRHPSYNYYPVVGVTWKQAFDFCIWRTDRVNEKALIDKGVINAKDYAKGGMNNVQEENFNTKSYLMGLYRPKTPPSKKSPLKDSKGQLILNWKDASFFCCDEI
ncbi:MAG: SUMF1/EgtB/PvdO family nonheme iron enzyme, partial [Chitinophagaceae bacterium]|nr:SUMF1/EgtB/PvdO family nonheme iron enzyme [Chitinophagaceae bacterium]